MKVNGIDVYYFRPRRQLIPGKIGSRIPLGRRLSNFGDELGPMIVRALVGDRKPVAHGRRMLAVGSVMHFARDGDVIWGTGVNGKIAETWHQFAHLDVRAVRGPLTREFLARKGIEVPAVFGDPGIVLPKLFPLPTDRIHELTVVPNYNDIENYAGTPNVLDPRDDVWSCLNRIARSEFVVGSSLHSVIIAESLGIPARLLKSDAELPFKYEDYYLGTGRDSYRAASSVAQALEWGGEPPLAADTEALLKAFPDDLWRAPAEESHSRV